MAVVLTQKEGDEERLVVYSNLKLNPREKVYVMIRRECPAIK